MAIWSIALFGKLLISKHIPNRRSGMIAPLSSHLLAFGSKEKGKQNNLLGFLVFLQQKANLLDKFTETKDYLNNVTNK